MYGDYGRVDQLSAQMADGCERPYSFPLVLEHTEVLKNVRRTVASEYFVLYRVQEEKTSIR